MSEFVNAYAKSTGKKQRIPKHWLGHPVLGRDFQLTPSARAAEEADQTVVIDGDDPGPVTTWFHTDLDTTNPDATQADDKTPAAGDDKEN